ncbi:cytochrome P450 [Actinoalloteichus hymeniacidonis]|uniref:Cytochrome P450 n=1 Tax=Actinoalloteichus hymeniacidonis TaxID=340345 RepID=A0AAC9MYL7_9PSEU|nr:cytochrome P450 [Actinoalloteichus hymeniacidonis]AOS63122.1 cytochrome P450 [Actinoalloteichus hymeniacidonis]MBB5908842.1 cytochrome P450 [Actinoalloteichus hymeniacidonis]
MTTADRSGAITLPTTRDNPFDPPAELLRLRADRGIHPLAYPDGHQGWLVTDYQAIRTVMADPRFSARQELRRLPFEHPLGVQPQPPAEPGMFIRMDPPDHTRYRSELIAQFTVRRMRALEPRIVEIVEAHAAAMRAQGPPADLVSSFALPIPSLVICELLGVPYADRAVFQETTAALLRLDQTPEQFGVNMATFHAFLGELVTAKRTEPTDDILGGLITDTALSDRELVSIGLLLLVAGHETTANMLGLGTFALLRHPEQLAALRADPTLIDGAVEELLRYLSIIQFGTSRCALERVELAGVTIEEGQNLILSLPAANRDPERFPDPDRLDVTRGSARHLSFGHGVHQCLGQQLARTEMRVGFATLIREFPDLRLAVEPHEVVLTTDKAIYGVHSLPVAW